MATTNTYLDASFQVVKPVDFRAAITRYLRHWPWFIVSLALAMAGAYVYLAYQQPQYRMEARLLIQHDGSGSRGAVMLKDFEGGAFKDKEIENEIEVLYTYTLMEKVIQKLNLDTN